MTTEEQSKILFKEKSLKSLKTKHNKS